MESGVLRAGQEWRVLVALMVAAVASATSMTVAPVAVPAIARHFHLGQDQAHWVTTGFMAAMTLAMLPTPWLVSRFGFRRVYEASAGLLLVGALCSSVAPVFPLLVAARLLEGAAAGILQPLPVIVVAMAFEPATRGRAMGVFTLGMVLAPALAPTAAGLLVDAFGWRAAFLALLPFGLMALALGRSLSPYEPPRQRTAPLDLPSIAMAAAALLGMLLGLTQWRVAGGASASGLIGASLLLAVAFLRRQGRSKHPLLALSLFSHRDFALSCAVAFIYGLGMFGSAYLVPVFMQQALHRSATEAGSVLLPAGLVLAVASPLGGWLADRFAAHRIIAFGMALLGATFAGMLGIRADTGLVVVMAWLLVSRFGMAMVLPSLNLSALQGLPAAEWTAASAAINFVRQLGAAIGVSLVALFLQWRLHAGAVGGSVAAPASVAAFHETFALVALVCLAGVFISCIPRKEAAVS